jgi:hypothetical protein
MTTESAKEFADVLSEAMSTGHWDRAAAGMIDARDAAIRSETIASLREPTTAMKKAALAVASGIVGPFILEESAKPGVTIKNVVWTFEAEWRAAIDVALAAGGPEFPSATPRA